MFDLLLFETGEGADLQLLSDDFVSTDTYEGLIYLALFSGDDFWGNHLYKEKYQCKTEKALRENTISSAGRIKIEEAIKNDLNYLKKHIAGVDISVETKIPDINRLHIRIRVADLVYIYEYNGDKTIYLNEEEW